MQSSWGNAMPPKINLDAMIQRADFALEAPETTSAEQIASISAESISGQSLLMSLLRKPDFQRETNHWTSDQITTFLESFLDNELIPSIILWRSQSFVFVIDGGHRLSALRAWILDDYGDGTASRPFYGNNLSREQKRTAEQARTLINERIGQYALMRAALLAPSEHPDKIVKRARNMTTRSLSLQWVVGDAEKAETSFFKINTQGTPLDDTEELLLRNRSRSVAIAARSIVRAGSGHKYWSKFAEAHRKRIEELSKQINESLFHPEIDEPIKTLDLPLAGSVSPVSGLELLVRLISIANLKQRTGVPQLADFPVDIDGSETIKSLERCSQIVGRISGNTAASLGLHPAVYFYTNRGRHNADLFLGVVHLFAQAVANNDTAFFKRFTTAREKIEKFLIEKKPLVTAVLQSIGSRQRVERVSELFARMVGHVNAGEDITEDWVIAVVGPRSSSRILVMAQESAAGPKFAKETKSEIYLKQSLEKAMQCPICRGYIEPAKSASFDHIHRVRDGGLGTATNGQITHPFCNTGFKN